MFKKTLLAIVLSLAWCSGAIAAEPAPAPAGSLVVLETNVGNIRIMLHEKAAPITSKNFINYVTNGFYNGTIFHRVIPGFMIQGGGFTPELQVKPTGAPIRNEADNGLANDRGTIAMARTANPNSATSQFFINVVDNKGLNKPMPDGYGYAVFGKVIEGMDVVDRIAGVKTSTQRGFNDVPVSPVIIKTARIEKR